MAEDENTPPIAHGIAPAVPKGYMPSDEVQKAYEEEMKKRRHELGLDNITPDPSSKADQEEFIQNQNIMGLPNHVVDAVVAMRKKANATDALESLDSNRNGRIDQNEIAALTNNQETIDRVKAALDKNGDGNGEIIQKEIESAVQALKEFGGRNLRIENVEALVTVLNTGKLPQNGERQK